MSEPTPSTQPGLTIHGPQTNITGGVTQHGGLFNTGVIYGNVVIPPPQPTRAISPAPPPDFVGREQQLADLTNLLTAGHTAAITALRGMGGIGKTALAQTLAVRLEPHFAGGIFWASLVDYNGSAETILRAWGALCGADLSQEPDPAVLTDRVRGLFAMRRDTHGPLLVVIDDIRTEWLAAAQVLKRTLPAGTPLLLTLRAVDLAEALDATVIPIDVLPATDAEALLTVRVKSPDILTPKATVNTLLAQLGYLPLAIRLAAGHINKFTRKPGFDLGRFVEEIARRAVDLLAAAGGSGLAATFALSYNALTVDQQRIFRHCSIYSPSLLTVEHMACLMNMAPELVETALDELVAVALLDWDQTQPRRYRLHPLLAQYAYTLLFEQEADIRAIHRLAAIHIEQKLVGAGATPIEALEGVDQWEKAQAWEKMISLTSALVENLDRFGYWHELEARLDQAQAHIQDISAHKSLVATFWNARGILAFKQARWDTAIAYHREAIQTLAHTNDIGAIAKIKDNLGIIYAAKGEWETAILHHELALQSFTEVENHHEIAKTKCNLGLVYTAKGEWDKAISNLLTALPTFQSTHDLHALATTCHNLGFAYRNKGEWEIAFFYYQQALQIFEDMGHTHAVAQVQMGLGLVYGNQEQWDTAIFYHQQALQTVKRIGDTLNMAFTYNNLGIAYQCKDDWNAATECYEQALPIFEAIGDSHNLAHTYNNLGLAYSAISQWDTAIAYYRKSLQVKAQIGDRLGMARTYGNLGTLYHACDKLEEAAHYVAKAFLIFYERNAVETQQLGDYLAQMLGSPAAANAYLHHFLQQPDEPTR